MNEREKLLKKVQMAAFSLYETGLYLDTHNTDQEALKYYQKCKQKAKALEDEYVSKYGPLYLEQNSNEKVWDWSKGPWPWEYSAN